MVKKRERGFSLVKKRECLFVLGEREGFHWSKEEIVRLFKVREISFIKTRECVIGQRDFYYISYERERKISY